MEISTFHSGKFSVIPDPENRRIQLDKKTWRSSLEWLGGVDTMDMRQATWFGHRLLLLMVQKSQGQPLFGCKKTLHMLMGFQLPASTGDRRISKPSTGFLTQFFLRFQLLVEESLQALTNKVLKTWRVRHGGGFFTYQTLTVKIWMEIKVPKVKIRFIEANC